MDVCTKLRRIFLPVSMDEPINSPWTHQITKVPLSDEILLVELRHCVPVQPIVCGVTSILNTVTWCTRCHYPIEAGAVWLQACMHMCHPLKQLNRFVLQTLIVLI